MKRLLPLAGIGVVALVIAAGLIWLNFFRDEGPDEFSLTEDTTVTSETTDVAESSEDSTAEESAGEEDTGESETSEGGDLEDVDGTWTVAEGSEAGYRVVEDLQNIQDFEAVGRTDQVSGSVTIEGTVVSEATFEIDVASITSDSGRRDSAFAGADIMNTAEFPTATFVLTEPADFGSVPAAGEVVTTTVFGDLTLRDSTQSVELTIDAQTLDGQIELVGSIDVIFADFGIDNPSHPFVTVRDEGTVEVRLLLER